MDVNDVSGAGSAGFVARRVFMPRQGVESWTLIGPDRRPVEPVDRYLSHLTFVERSPNTIEGYARDLKAYFSFLADRGLRWDRVGVAELAEFAAWVRRPASNVIVLADEAARLSPRSVNRMLTAVVGFYEFHGREGNDLARRLVVETRSGHGSFKPFLHGLARPRRRGRAIRLREVEALPRTLTLEQVAAVIDGQTRLRDRLLFALLASTGMRIGQALGLKHEDVESWRRTIHIVWRPDAPARARSKAGASGSIPVPGELIRLWSDYMHEEYGELDSEWVFVNLWSGRIGQRMSYGTIDALVERTSRRVGFAFTPHQLRHTYATLALRDGVALEVISALLTHRSVTSTQVYARPGAEDLRRALAARGVLDKVGDLLT